MACSCCFEGIGQLVRSKDDSPRTTSGKPVSGKLLERYRLENVLGQGASGLVYRCVDKTTGTVLAVKMVGLDDTPFPTIKREVEMLTRLAHPCVSKLVDVFYEPAFVCIVMHIYNGGDLMKGMTNHWGKSGMIPVPAVQRVAKQVWAPIAFLHSMLCVHRDIKGDNFMIDLPDLEHPDNRVYLADFGTVRELHPGDRLKKPCGTKHYWPPEFFKQDYGIKVDVWAAGVITFGLFSGKFPFKDQNEVKHIKLKYPSRVPDDAVSLLKLAFDRSEATRIDAATALEHAFLKDDAPCLIRSGTSPASGDDLGDGTDMTEKLPNAAMRSRRRLLVERLAGKKMIRTISHDKNSYVVMDERHGRGIKYKWVAPEDTAKFEAPFRRAEALPGATRNNDLSKRDVQRMLVNHGVPLDSFAKTPGTKPFSDLFTEIQDGKCRLLIDATRYKSLVRVADVVTVRVQITIRGSMKYLLETGSSFANGKTRADSLQLPGCAKDVHKNCMQVAHEFCRDILPLAEFGIELELSGKIIKNEVDSPSVSFPNVRTVYNKESVTVKLVGSPESLEKLVKKGSFEITRANDYSRSYAWMTQEECSKKKLQLNAEPQKFSGLVPPPVGLDEEELNDFLVSNKVPLEHWGRGGNKSLAEFSEELVKGEAALEAQAGGQAMRVVDIVIVHLLRYNGQVLVESGEVCDGTGSRPGVEVARTRLPAIKRRSDEHHFLAAKRLLEELHLPENEIEINATSVKVLEELAESTSYFGLKTLYRKRYMTATWKN